MRQLGLNPFCVVLLPRFDLANGKETVFCDWKTNELCRVSGVGYDLLELIDSNNQIEIEKVLGEMGQYLKYFMNRGIIEIYE